MDVTAHPGTVQAVIKIDLPRPRDPLSVEFLDCQKQLMRHLGHDKSAAEMAKLSANGKAKASA